jgi:hypothetical protein
MSRDAFPTRGTPSTHQYGTSFRHSREMTIEDLVASFLSPSEHVKAVLETLVAPEPGSATPDGADIIDPRFSVQDTRILAVVSHIDEWSLSEEGWYV